MNKILTFKFFSILAAFLVVALYIYSFNTFSANIPSWDDYDSILGFTNQFLAANNISDKISLLFSQHNEHRIVLPRLVFLADHLLEGAINFKTLIALGNICLIASFALITLHLIRRIRIKNYLSLPVIALLLFNYSHYDGMVWSTVATTHYGAIFLALVSFTLLQNKDLASNLWAILFAVSVSFTNGNGLFIFPSVLAALWIARDLRFIRIWVAAAILTGFLYLLHYHRPADSPQIMLSISTALSSLSFFLQLPGYAFGLKHSLFAGVILFVVLGVMMLCYRKIFCENIFLSGMLLFIILTLMLIALTRSSFGIEYADASRYKIYSMFLFVFILIFMILISRQDSIERWAIYTILLLSFQFYIGTLFSNIPWVLLKQAKLNISQCNYDRGTCSSLDYPDPQEAQAILIASSQNGVYRIKDH